ncbi:MAG: hypothetical protein K9I82_01355 [Chitinophagaceae bacterium]|nr:hypothetical protein [Chitinophagaceae bacterium]
MLNFLKFFNQKKNTIILNDYIGEYKADDGRTGKLYAEGDKIKFTYDGKTITFNPDDEPDEFKISYFPFKGFATFTRDGKGKIKEVKAELAGYIINAKKIA